DDDARAEGSQAPPGRGAVEGFDRQGEGERPPRIRDGAETERLLAAPARDGAHAGPRSGRDPDAQRAHRCRHAAGAAGCVQAVLPGGPANRRDADPGGDGTVGGPFRPAAGPEGPAYFLSCSLQRFASSKTSARRSPSDKSRRRSFSTAISASSA